MQAKKSCSMFFMAVFGVLAFAFTACSPVGSGEGSPAKSLAAAKVPEAAPATLAQWNAAVDENFDKINAKKFIDKKNPQYVLDPGKIDEDGNTEFNACFDRESQKCKLGVNGKRDGFRKVQFFYDPIWDLHEFMTKYKKESGGGFVHGYISLKDCQRPKMVLKPIFRGDSWLFMEQFSLMVDGTVVLDRKLELNDVKRENNASSVTEVAHLFLDDAELAAIRSIDSSKQVIVRLTGKKGHTGLGPESTKHFVEGLAFILPIFNTLDQTTKKVGPVKDAACPA